MSVVDNEVMYQHWVIRVELMTIQRLKSGTWGGNGFPKQKQKILFCVLGRLVEVDKAQTQNGLANFS